METATASKSVELGTIFSCSWGYEQTNVDYYQVIGLTKSGASVKVRRINSERVATDSWASGKVMPVKDSFAEGFRSEAMTKRLKWYNGQPCFRVASYAHAYLWDGKPEFYSEWH